MVRFRMAVFLLVILITSINFATAQTLRVATFKVDATPPKGSPLAYDPAVGVDDPLSCRGVVILGSGKPIVLCAVDWLGIANGGQTAFREALATAAGTDADRVAVHTLHQHDASRCDFAADELLRKHGVIDGGFNVRHARQVIVDAATAIKSSLKTAQPVTHYGIGSGVIKEVASNRRILGENGQVVVTRYTATRDPKVRAMPVGTIDPELKMISFWNGEKPIVALSYYATHPQSYYRTGRSSVDFPGLARNAREKETGVPHIHFNGAGGNIGAGKWNDGSKENRPVIADKVAAGMKLAWDGTIRKPITANEIDWHVEPTLLPVADHLVEEEMLATLKNKDAKMQDRWFAAKHLVWLHRCQSGDPIDVSCLEIGNARLLHLPGELFVEYQLAAQAMRKDQFIAMAAYGDYAPGYIGTEIAYSQGGYETSNRASRVTKDVEKVLLDAIEKLLTMADR